jgi:hypothetical protein
MVLDGLLSVVAAEAPSEAGSSVVGLLITTGGTVVVALIGTMAMRDAKKKPVVAEPTPIQDVWEENRKRGQDIQVLQNELRVVRAALTVALDWIERALRAWFSNGRETPPPELSRREFEILEKSGEELPFTPVPHGGLAEPEPTP